MKTMAESTAMATESTAMATESVARLSGNQPAGGYLCRRRPWQTGCTNKHHLIEKGNPKG